MVEGAVGGAGVGGDLDAVVSVDAIRIFKPRPEVYALVTNYFKCASKYVTFVSSNRWDVMGAVSFRFRALWVNRGQMPDEYANYSPEQMIGDMSVVTHSAPSPC